MSHGSIRRSCRVRVGREIPLNLPIVYRLSPVIARNFCILLYGFHKNIQIFRGCEEIKTAAPNLGKRRFPLQNSPASQSASGRYAMGRNMAGSILPTLIRSLPSPSILTAMPMISAPPTAVISVMTASGR